MTNYTDFERAIDKIRLANSPLDDIADIFISGMSTILGEFPRNTCYALLSPKQRAHALVCCFIQYEERTAHQKPYKYTSPKQRAYNTLAFGYIARAVETTTPLGDIVIQVLKDVQKSMHLIPAPFLQDSKL